MSGHAIIRILIGMEFLAEDSIRLLDLLFRGRLVDVEELVVVFHTQDQGNEVEEKEGGKPQHSGAQDEGFGEEGNREEVENTPVSRGTREKLAGALAECFVEATVASRLTLREIAASSPRFAAGPAEVSASEAGGKPLHCSGVL